MAAKRKTSQGTRKPASAGAKKAPAKKRAASKNTDIDCRWSILLFALGALFIVLAFVPGADGWLALRDNVLFGGLGISGWLLGPMLLYWAVLISLGRPVFSAIIKGVLFMVALSGAALVFGKAEFSGVKFGPAVALLLETGKTHFGGGLLGLLLGWTMLVLIGRPAANVLLVLFLLIAVMVLTGVTPGDIVRFFGRLWANRPRRAAYFEDDYDEEEETEYVPKARRGRKPRIDSSMDRGGMVAAGRGAPVRDVEDFAFASTRVGPANARGKSAGVDIDLGFAPSAPGLAEHDEVVIGPGGTFGMNPLEAPAEEPLMPFDPYSSKSLFDTQPGGDVLLFGQDDPYVNLGGAQTVLPRGNLFDVEYVPEPVAPPEQRVQQDIFGRKGATPPVQKGDASTDFFMGTQVSPDVPPWEEPPQKGQQMFSGGAVVGVATSDPTVDAMIDRAALAKQDKADAAPVTGAGVMGSLNQPLLTQPYMSPPLALFKTAPATDDTGAREEMKKTADLLVSTLASFGVQTRILDVSRGPSVTRYEVQPQAGVKISRITGLSDDIALNLAAAGVRIEAPIPGKPAVGIEVPNRIKTTVSIRSILESNTFASASSPLSVALGKDIAGDVVVADLTKMPHLLIAGSTGSGKSVCVNATIMSFLYKSSPEDVRLLLIDPKVVELAEYNGIPHLLMPVVTEPRKAAGALGSAVAEMERRYHLFAENNVRDIKTFNKRAERYGDLERLPHIAIVIDELADLMMTSGKEVEDYICRIAQKARAAGMHLIVATQRPSVDVITGLIKANIPSRIAFAVSSQVDSRTILDGGGAEKLLGMGDMLFMPVGANKPVRVQGTFVQDKEISDVLKYIKGQSDTQYDEGMIEEMERRAAPEGSASEGGGEDMLRDATFISAVETALEQGQISTSFLQRRLRLGYARAGRIMDEMERLHIVSPPDGSKPRQVLINRQQWLEMSMNNMPDGGGEE